jgi:hypothetical protein
MKAVLLAQIVVVGIAAAVAILHFLLSFRHEARTLHRMFAFFSLSAAGEAATSALRYRASSAEEFVSFARWGYTFQCFIVITLLWFITFYTDRERTRILKALTVAVFVVLILNLAAPFGMIFKELPHLSTVRLSWGEPIVFPVGKRSPLLLVMNLVAFPSMCYIVWCWFRFWRYGDRRKARFLGLGLAPFILMAYPQGLMVNWGLLTLPYLYSYAYLAFVMLMSSNSG